MLLSTTMTSQPDIFTTLRYIPSDKSLTPSKSDIPLFELHIQRLKRGLAYFGLKLTTATDDLDWEHEVWSALERVIAEKGIDKGLRVSSSCSRPCCKGVERETRRS